ncbi:hypothetical protein [Rathayibacter tanaceti]|uniref:D-mannose binding lectin n=1 Tax=Rathayibacter tanaceti TaxID=1671680 RepID=A0A162J1B7_9MICO|nr:hypothetical protein [Rathayibacter tanaceti]KZX20757.1 D-mannose binding lectin [Rathayibacter tanaceti]
MPQSPTRRLAAITLACLLASGGAAAFAPAASALPAATAEALAAQNVLSGGGALLAGQQLTSSNGRARAAMQGDGNFVVYIDGSARWSSVTSGGGNRLEMQPDGNAVVYAPGGGSRWASNTQGNPGARMVMQDDGNLVVYASSGRPLWSSSTSIAPVVRDVLVGGTELRRGQQLTSTDGGSRAALQGDGNFVVSSGGAVRWSAGTQGAGERLAVQTDGNAVVYSASGRALWQSGTAGNPGARLVMQNDGNLVVYSASGRALWSSYTPPAPPAPTFGDTLFGANRLTADQRLRSTDGRSEAAMQGDGNFVVYSGGGVRWSAGTSGGGNRLEMQADGNAVVYAPSGRVLWQSGTGNNSGSRMVMQNDGNLVIYSPQNRALWQSNRPAPTPPGNPGDSKNCDDFGSQAEAQPGSTPTTPPTETLHGWTTTMTGSPARRTDRTRRPASPSREAGLRRSRSDGEGRSYPSARTPAAGSMTPSISEMR